MRSGGHVVWVCGQNVQPVAYNAMNALAQGHLLPAPLEDLRQPLPGGVESWHVGFLDKDNPALAPLTEPASLYQSVLVYKHFPDDLGRAVDGPGADRSSTTASHCSWSGRSARARSCSSGPRLHVDWTNLPLKPLFLPLLTRLTFHLAGAEAERTMGLAGAPVSVPLGKGSGPGQGPAMDAEVEVVRPSGEVVRVPQERSGRQRLPLRRYSRGRRLPGPAGRPASLPHSTAFAVNIDPAESDPATLTRQELQSRFGNRPLVFCENPDDLAETITRLREGTSLWEWFLAAVLVGLVLEVFLANRGASAGP